MIDADGFCLQAREIAERRLSKARGLLTAVTEEERHAIEQVAYAVAARVAERLLEEAVRDEIVARAIDSPPSTAGAEEVTHSLLASGRPHR